MILKGNWKRPVQLRGLGPQSKAVLYGHGGAGKSAVVEALQLALQGEIAGLDDRDAKDARVIARGINAVDGGDNLAVTLYGEDGLPRASYVQAGTKRGVHTAPAGSAVFGVADVRAALHGSAKVAADWLAQHAPAITPGDVHARCKKKLARSPHKAAALAALEVLAANGSNPEAVAAAIRAALNTTRAKAATAQSAAATTTAALRLVTDEELNAAATAVSAAQAALTAVQQQVAAVNQWIAAAQRLAGLQAQPVASVGGVPLPPAQIQTFRAVLAALAAHAEWQPQAAVCPCCLGAMRYSREQVGGFLRAQLEQEDARQRAQAWAAAVQQATAALQPLAGQIHPQLLGAVRAAGNNAPATAWEQQARTQLQQALEHKSALEAARVAYRAVEVADGTAAAAAAKVEELAALDKAYDAALVDAAAAALDDFVGLARKFIPPRFGKLEVALKPLVSVGYAQPTADGGTKIGIASGQEKAAAMLALAAAVVERNVVAADVAGQDPPLTVLIGEDVSWHPDQIAELCELLKDVPAMIFLQSAVPPSGVPVEGWAYLDVDRADTLAPPAVTDAIPGVQPAAPPPVVDAPLPPLEPPAATPAPAAALPAFPSEFAQPREAAIPRPATPPAAVLSSFAVPEPPAAASPPAEEPAPAPPPEVLPPDFGARAAQAADDLSGLQALIAAGLDDLDALVRGL